MGEGEKTEGHSYKSPAVVGLRADPTSDKISGKRRKEQGGVGSFRGMLPVGPGYQQGKQQDIALTGEEVKPEPESQEGILLWRNTHYISGSRACQGEASG